ncbi:MAG: PQQ-binding-like beta-propeller repeat protein [Haloarculaceae archaeon]
MLVAVGAAFLAGCNTASEAGDSPGANSDRGPATPTATSADAPTASATPGGTPTDDGPTETPLPDIDGAPPSVTDGWHTYGNGLGNRGSVASDVPPGEGMGLYWRRYVEGQFSIPEPAVVDDALYFGSGRFLYALDQRDGGLRWEAELGEYAHVAAATVTDDTVYAGTRRISDPKLLRDTPGTLYAVDRETGAVRWERDAVITSGTTVHDGHVYLSTTPMPPQRGLVRALDAATGETNWAFSVGDSETVDDGTATGAFGTPALDPGTGTLYATGTVGTGDDVRGTLFALDATTGSEQWRLPLPAGIKHGPVLAGERLYVGDAAGRLSAFSTAGESVWTTRVGGEGIDATPALTPDGEAVCASSVGTLACVETASGETRWERDVEDIRRSGLTIAGDHLYVGGIQFLTVDVESGDLVAEVPVDGAGGAYGQPVVCEDTIYVGSCIKQGKRYVYDNYLYVMG